LKTNFKLAASVPFHVLEEVTRIDTEELQDSSDENSKKQMKLLSQLSIVSQNALTWG